MTLQDLNGVLRSQAWQRAKGELHAVLASYVSEGAPEEVARFERMNELVHDFIQTAEWHGLPE